MKSHSFFNFGAFVYRNRYIVILVWALIIACGLPFITNIMSPFHSTGFVDERSLSFKTDKYLDKQLPYNKDKILIIYHSKTLQATNPLYINAIKQSLHGLKRLPIAHQIIYPDMNNKQISNDKHTSYSVIVFNTKQSISTELLGKLKTLIKKPHNMTMILGGEPFFINEINKQTQTDLYHADVIAAPIAIIILLLIFGTVIAAIIPVVLSAGCALLILTSLYAIAHMFSLSIFTINIALLLGICLSLDYSLFIISRFREELTRQPTTEKALAETLATAGKAVFFSGLAVFVSLSALLLFPINILFSVGVGGLSAVFIAVVTAIIVLPAILAVLKTRINYLPVRLFKNTRFSQYNLWRKLATVVVKRPILFFIPTLIFLLFLGAPFLNANLGVSDANILPKHSDSRNFFDMYKRNFNAQTLTPISLVVSTDNDSILSAKNISKLYDLTHKLQKMPLVENVDSIVNTTHSFNKQQYQQLYASITSQHKSLPVLLKINTSKQMTVINIFSKYDANSSKTKTLINELRNLTPGTGLTLRITGIPVNNQEVLHTIASVFPYALIWIVILTYIILLYLLRSLFLPLKAIVMNLLSLCATYGVLVFVFQEGNLHHLLNFEPQGIVDVSLLVIIFCALFGFSMDYEVFLLTRIQESYVKTRNNDQSIIFGIEHSSKIITSAAIIVIVTCGSFMVADVLMVKEFGLGIAMAIFVDAFIVRSIFVPSTMALVKKWNWYLPKILNKIIPKP